MDEYLRKLLKGEVENCWLPFVWQRGESEEIIKKEIDFIHKCGITSICIESRSHPDFCGTQWWHDMDIIIAEAKRLNMKLWVLDDSNFPTGYANGWILNKYPEKRKTYLVEKHIDVVGPLMNASVISNVDSLPHLNEDRADPLKNEDELIVSVAVKKKNGNEYVPETLVDLTAKVVNGMLYWDIPEGVWRVFFVYTSVNGGGRPFYTNNIDADSVKVLIDAVYEEHLSHYQNEFGKTFAGFFSDEPEMGNALGYDFKLSIGHKGMVLPWGREVVELLCERLGDNYMRYLPYLWYDIGSIATNIRYIYMDTITHLYEKNFSNQIGNWCRNHGVEYIGHVVEDCGNHARLGSGAGHFFRALKGQDMSGIDVVLQQILPGFDEEGKEWLSGDTGNEFFHYGLAKMGSSFGHIDPLKKGRTMCEIYGAYGWVEGLKLMKWLTDHMVVRGINIMTPHAFSQHTFPDPDCPPHFYAHGMNPQHRFFGVLARYAIRLCSLFNNGTHVATAAVLYHAEAEWSGNYMPFEKPVRVLLQNQIDCDVLPVDVFMDREYYKLKLDGKELVVNGEKYKCFIVPYSQFITSSVAKFIAEANASGLTTIFVDKLPDGICDEENLNEQQKLMDGIKNCKVISLNRIVSFMFESGFYEIKTSNEQKYLRNYHYNRQSTEVFMFFNEHPYNDVITEIGIPFAGSVSSYDAFSNKLVSASVNQDGISAKIELKLSPYESKIYVFGKAEEDLINVNSEKKIDKKRTICDINGRWKVALATADEYPNFTQKKEMEQLINISSQECYPEFSGTIEYETSFKCENIERQIQLDLGYVYETAEVWVNNVNAGIKICPPYLYDVSGLLHEGKNLLRIEVTNTLVHSLKKSGLDSFSANVALEPSGLMGPVCLLV
jgi:hypothetical protein